MVKCINCRNMVRLEYVKGQPYICRASFRKGGGFALGTIMANLIDDPNREREHCPRFESDSPEECRPIEQKSEGATRTVTYLTRRFHVGDPEL